MKLYEVNKQCLSNMYSSKDKPITVLNTENDTESIDKSNYLLTFKVSRVAFAFIPRQHDMFITEKVTFLQSTPNFPNLGSADQWRP